jgi:catechol 2,3-dioxygenase-like lactoylglutathione lyase family enzyme
MRLPPRIGLVTLAVRDIERMADLFRALGWPEAPSSEPPHRVFQLTNGVAIALYGAERYERAFGPIPEGFRGFTLCVNLGSMAEVRAAHAALAAIPDVDLLEDPQEAEWGGGFSWRDPEGNVWDVAWADGSTFDERGGLTFP